MIPAGIEKTIHIPSGSVSLEGFLAYPEGAGSVVVFAHGSGSSRYSPRNRFVADEIYRNGTGVLLFDLLTPEEDRIYENRFDIDLLAERLQSATYWVSNQPEMREPSIGYFGASTGAAAAIRAAAEPGMDIRAIVSRGGRPDLAMDSLGGITAPTLLIVGGLDDLVIELNRRAYELIRAPRELKIIPGATHLFEEPGALEEVARLAAGWFRRYL